MFGAILFLIVIAAMVAFIAWRKPEFKVQLAAIAGSIGAAAVYFWEQISGWFN